MAPTKTYIGSFSTNNGATYGVDYTDSNLRRLRKTMRAIVAGNTHQGNSGYWSIDLAGRVVAEGTVKS